MDCMDLDICIIETISIVVNIELEIDNSLEIFLKGNTVRYKYLGKDIRLSFKTLVGGELSGYNEILSS